MASLLSRRTPLGDLSNSLKTGIPHDASKKKASGKTAGRKALSDISNTGRRFNGRASERTKKQELNVLIEEPMELHNHQLCIEAQKCIEAELAFCIDELLQSPGLHKDCSEKLATPFSPPPLSPPSRVVPLKEMDEQFFGEERRKFDSPSPPRTPELPELYRDWEVNFKLIESLEFARP